MTIYREPTGLPPDEFGSIFSSLSQQERVDYMTGVLNGKLTTPPNEQWRTRFADQFKAASLESQRDIALTIRARGISDEHALLEQVGANRDIFLFDSPGVFVVPGNSTAKAEHTGSVVGVPDSRVILAAPTWAYAYSALECGRFGRSTVILPETVTIAGEIGPEEVTNRERVQAVVTQNLTQACQLSEHCPEASFIIGSPYFIEGLDQPLNTAVHIQNGHVAGFVFKFNGVAAERHFFAFPDDRTPYSVTGEDSVLICKDLLTLCNSLSESSTKHHGHPKRSTDPAKFVTDTTQELLVTSCWGVGAESEVLAGHEQERIDRTYARTMILTVNNVMERLPALRQVIISDRIAALSRGSKTQAVGAKPLSLVAFRHFTLAT